MTSDRLSASLGLFDRSMEEAVEGIRTTHAKDGIISLSGVIGDIFPLKKAKIKPKYLLEDFSFVVYDLFYRFYIHKKYYLVKCRSFWRLNQLKIG